MNTTTKVTLIAAGALLFAYAGTLALAYAVLQGSDACEEEESDISYFWST